MATPNPLGRIKLHDPQSREYPYPRKAVRRSDRTSIRHRMQAPNVDQFYTSGCVGFSGTNMLNCGFAVRSRQKMNDWMEQIRHNRYLDNDAGIENYHQATVYDPFKWTYPPTDEGSSAIGLMKFWKKFGIISEYQWAFTFDQFLAALQRQPVLIGTQWFENMMNPTPQGVAIPGGASVGGHEYLANALLWDRQWIGFENSWSDSGGIRGRFYMTFDAVKYLLENDGDAVIPRFL